METIPQLEPITPTLKVRRRRYLGEVLTARIFMADRLKHDAEVDRLLRLKTRWLRRQRRERV